MASANEPVVSTLTIAHRGASQQAPENTIPAIEKALETGAEAIALDVQGTKDDEPVVFADAKLERTTNQAGRLSQFSLKEIQALDAGSWFKPEFKGTKVPTLAQGLKEIGSKARLMLQLPDLRADSALAKNIVKALAARKKPAEDVLLFTNSDTLKAFRELAPDFGYALALGDRIEGWVAIAKAEKLGLKIVRPHRAQVNAAFVRQAHEKGMKVLVHFADEEDEMQELLKLRVDGIVTGRPERLKRVLEEQTGAEA
jgi:glycerophosphoryl diester phosphodiesterase